MPFKIFGPEFIREEIIDRWKEEEPGEDVMWQLCGNAAEDFVIMPACKLRLHRKSLLYL